MLCCCKLAALNGVEDSPDPAVGAPEAASGAAGGVCFLGSSAGAAFSKLDIFYASGGYCNKYDHTKISCLVLAVLAIQVVHVELAVVRYGGTVRRYCYTGC